MSLNRKVFSLLLFLSFVVVLSNPTAYGEEERKMSSDYRSLVSQALPLWDDKVLNVPASKIWTDKTSMQAVARGVNDKVLMGIEREKKTSMYQDKERTVKIDQSRGRIRYLNNSREFQMGSSPKTAIDKQKAEGMMTESLRMIGLPADEFQKPRVDTVVAQGGSTKTKKPDAKIYRERLVTVERMINSLPVFGSMSRGSVSNEGEISRLLIKWPDFIFTTSKRLMERDAVIEKIVKRIDSQMKGQPVSVTIRLGYIQSPVAEKMVYVPGVVVSVLPSTTGFIFSVPVTE